MHNIFYRYIILTTIILLISASICLAETSVAKTESGYAITAASYTAIISTDGGITSMKAGKTEFLNTNHDFKQGTYFHQNGIIPLQIVSSIISPEDNILIAKSDKASVTYKFNDAGIGLTVQNLSTEYMNFFIIFDKSVKAVSGIQNEIIRTPVNESWQSISFYKDAAKLTASGATRLWGPWFDHQVFEVGLIPGQTRNADLAISSSTADEAATVKKLIAPRIYDDKDINILSPSPWQVFQRSSRYKGKIFVSGRLLPECTKLLVKISGKSLKGELPDIWQEVPINKIAKSFSAYIPTVPGGWYAIDFKALNGDKTVGQARIDNVGIGEVFVGAGQSNSTNCGQERIQQISGMVSSFSGEFWQPANDPQPGPHDRTQGGSFWPAFGDALYSKYRVPIGVVVTGHGGTNITQWQPDDPMGLFPWMMERINKLGPLGFRAVLWHQGESDALTPTDEYVEKMLIVIRQSNYLANWQFPWFVVHASYHSAQNPSWPLVRAAQSQLWEKGIALQGPDTDILQGDHRDYEGKGIHFSPKGLRAHGKLWAQKVSLYLNKVLDTDTNGK